MFRNVVIYCIYIFISQGALANDCLPTLVKVLGESSTISTDDMTLLERFENAVLKLDDIPYDLEIPLSRTKELREGQGLTRTIKLVSKHFKVNGLSMFLSAFQERLLKDSSFNNPSFIKRAFQAFKFIIADKHFYNENLFELTKMLNKNGGSSLLAKKKIIAQLDRLSKLFSLIFEKEIDLTKEEDIFSFFGVTSRKELGPRLSELTDFYKNSYSKIQTIVNGEVSGGETLIRVIQKLQTDFFNNKNRFPEIKDKAFFKNTANQGYIFEIIEKMDLEESQVEYYKKLLQKVAEDQVTNHKYQGTPNILILFHALRAANGKEDPLFQIFLREENITSEIVLSLRSRTLMESRLNDFFEDRFEDYVSKSDKLNAQRVALLEKFAETRDLDESFSSRIDELLNQFSADGINDFDEDLRRVARKLRRLELELDQVIEEIVSKKKIEEITSYKELNFRWERVIPGKSYKIEGIDYKNIVFNKEVVEFFAKDPRLGGRYLSVLQKSYVATLKKSGLRRLPSIHSDFRDIKLLRSHGKIRIIGKLINGKIHFFHVYNSSEAYKTSQIKALIERFQP